MAAKKATKKAPKKAPAKNLKAAKKPAPAKPAKKGAKASAAKKASARTAQPAIVHWEIQAQDAKRMQRFYGELFGWKVDAANPMNYGMVSSKGKEGIDGGIGGMMGGGRPRLLVYATVDDINDVLERAESLGAKTILPRTDVGPVIMGIFEDVEGNHFGVIEGGMV